MATLLEEMTRTYWRASLTVHGIAAGRPVSERTARRALAALARHGGNDRLRCAAGGTLVTHVSAPPPGTGRRAGAVEPPCDVEPA